MKPRLMLIALFLFTITSLAVNGFSNDTEYKLNDTIPFLWIEYPELSVTRILEFNMTTFLQGVLQHQFAVNVIFYAARPTLFSIEKCGQPIFFTTKPVTDSIVQIGEPWITHLLRLGNERCLDENFDFTIKLNSYRASHAKTYFNWTHPLPIHYDSNRVVAIEINQEPFETQPYKAFVNSMIYYAMHSAGKQSLLLVSNVSSPVDIVLEKCNITINTRLALNASGNLVIDQDLLSQLHRFTYSICPNDTEYYSFQMLISTEDYANGTIFFSLITHENDENIFWCFLFVVIALLTFNFFLCCRRRGTKQKYEIEKKHWVNHAFLEDEEIYSSNEIIIYRNMVQFRAITSE